MQKRHTLLLVMLLSMAFLILSTTFYPGGSQNDQNSVGYDWSSNYLCNLFQEKAINGMDNPARIWAVIGMLFLCIAFGLFFVIFSRRIPARGASKVIKYCGAGAMVFSFFAVTPLHDAIVRIASTLALLAMFYITVFVFKARLYFFAVLSVVTLLVMYACNYMYFGGQYLQFLPAMQKLSLVLVMGWMLGLHYFTSEEDFLESGQSKSA